MAKTDAEKAAEKELAEEQAEAEKQAALEAARSEATQQAHDESLAESPPVDPTSENAGVEVTPKKGAPKEQSTSYNDVVRSLREETAVPIGAGVSPDMQPRVAPGVSL